MTTDMPKTYDRFVSWGDVDEDGAGEQSTRKTECLAMNLTMRKKYRWTV